MRRCYLVCYDISDGRRLRRVNKVMKGYGESWQFSVFFCFLKEIDLVRMQSDLKQEVNEKKDQIIILDLGLHEEDARRTSLVIGKSLPTQETGVVVI